MDGRLARTARAVKLHCGKHEAVVFKPDADETGAMTCISGVAVVRWHNGRSPPSIELT